MDAFENLSLIPDSTYCDNLIRLSIGGKWDADAPSGLQRLLRRVMEKKTETFFSRLSKQSRGYQLRFWLFYWSSLYIHTDGGSLGTPGREYPLVCERFKKLMIAKYPDEVKTMEIALPFALGEVLWPGE
ncbi:MAG: hypothetical protein LBD23_04920 [Oscillospiraceae bacterium]|jgi:hypothetical protein|nr:hypothetical protein [Oscillospiraceae bacterium]